MFSISVLTYTVSQYYTSLFLSTGFQITTLRICLQQRVGLVYISAYAGLT